MNTQLKSKEPDRKPEQKRVAIATGGTAGHIFLALASAHSYRNHQRAEVVFFASTTKEALLIEQHGYPCFVMHGAPVARQSLARKAWGIGSVGIGFAEAIRSLRSLRPDLVVGFGSYASVAPLLAARCLRIRTAIHESNVMPGLANKFLGHIVDRIYLGFDEAARYFQKSGTLVTGNPVRPEIAESSLVAKEPPNGNRPARILVTGGSSGSQFLNTEVPDLVALLLGKRVSVEVLHQTGPRHDEAVRRAYCNVGIYGSVTPFIEDMPGAYTWADFVISCAGAATLAELATLGLPALVVPLREAAARHQVANAIAFAHHAGWWMSQDRWDRGAAAQRLATVLTEPSSWRELSHAARALSKVDASRIISEDIDATAGQTRRETPIAARSN